MVLKLQVMCKATKYLYASDSSLAVRIRGYVFIGVYYDYKPTSQLNDLISDVENAIACALPDHEIVLGGDMSLRPYSIEFVELREVLARHGLSLRSDPNTSTYSTTVHDL
mgnify:CR=1 FL=1